MSDYAVDIEGLTRRFGNFTAVDGVSLKVNVSEIFAFLGPNGAGKSTTIKMLTGLLKPSAGSGSVGGYDIYRQAEDIKQHIGYMSQKFSLYGDLTPKENLKFFGGIYRVPREKLKGKIDQLFETTPIGRSRKSVTASLPLGLKQRLALECAMLHDPPILFLDEPTAGVDPMARRGFWDIIYNASQKGTTVFLTTHYMDEAEHADRVAMIFSGKLRAIDTPFNLKANFAGGNLFQFETPDLIGTTKKLESENAIREVTVFGSRIHITMGAEYNLEKTALILKNTGIIFSELTTTRPSLEDVFINLTSEETGS
jgi:ABC-2 type transport system ATP-binding protein